MTGRDLNPAGAVDPAGELAGVLTWLWTSVAEPVLASLPPGGRVWWCPTGALSVFPLHAAGDGVVAVIDLVVSSYTSSLRALAESQTRPVTSPRDARLLLVAVPDAPHQAHLPHVRPEVERVARGYAGDRTTLADSAATRERVLAELPGHSSVHFACHGGQDLAHPSRGGLYLSDAMMTVADVADRITARADLAFLSACQTAISGTTLLDESIHLAAALQTIGFRHVVATLWSIFDDTSPEIAQRFYADLPALGPARALHEALTRARRDHPDAVTVWAPYVHIGP
jgi:CHAT domain-containing protein